MKKILSIILIIISINGLAQFPVTQSMGSATTKLRVNGGLEAVRGLINGVFQDTTAANADQIDFYNGAQIWTRSDRNFWLRDSVLNMWIRIAKFSEVSGGSQTLQQVFNTEVGGSVLTKDDTIQLSGFNWRIIGNAGTIYRFNSNGFFGATNTGAVTAITATSGSSLAFSGSTTSSAGSAFFNSNPSSTNSIIPVLVVERSTSGTAADGIGGSIVYQLERDNGSANISTLALDAFLSDVTNNYTTQLNVRGKLNGANDTLMNIQPLGIVRVNNNVDTLSTKAYARSVGGGGSGEANTASNVGSGSGVFKQKTGVDLEFRSLVAGDGIGIVQNTNDVTISSTIGITNNDSWYQHYLCATGGNAATEVYYHTTSGAGASIANIASSQIDGWMHGQRLTTGTTSSGICYYYAAVTAGSAYGLISINSGKRYSWKQNVRFEDLSDGTETYAYYAGFINDVTAFSSVTNGAGFRYAHTDSSGAWIAWTKAGGSVTEDATAITVAADTDYMLEVSIIGTVAYFYINKVLATSISTNVPNGSAQAPTTGVSFKKSAGTTARVAYIELMAYGKKDN